MNDDSVYDGLLGGDDSQWAFGTDFEDPLAGVDTTVPDGVDPKTRRGAGVYYYAPQARALADAVTWLQAKGAVTGSPLSCAVAAVSVGVVDGRVLCDLPYEEDVRAQTDMNVVQTGDGRFIEVQGTAEHAPFDRSELGELLDLAATGNSRLAALQRQALAGPSGEPFTVSSADSSPQSTQA